MNCVRFLCQHLPLLCNVMKINRSLIISAFVLAVIVAIALLLIWVKEWNVLNIVSSLIIIFAIIATGLLLDYAGKDFDAGRIAVSKQGLLFLGTCFLLGIISLVIGKWIPSSVLWSLYLLTALFFGIRIIILVIATREQRGE